MFADLDVKAKKAVYAMIGAPVVTGRRIKTYGTKMADLSQEWVGEARDQFDVFAAEGEKIASQMREGNVVEELTSRMDLKLDLEHIQDRVEKVRDQLEHALENWRENFTPGEEKKAEKTPDEKVEAAKKAAASVATAKKAPAKKPAAKKPAAKKPAAKKATTTKKSPATSKS